MTGPEASLIGGATAGSTLLLLNYAIGTLSGTSRGFRRVVQGEPSLLIHDGKAIESHMASEHVSMDELHRALREHGIAYVCDVALAVLEVDGSISRMKYDEIKPDANPHLVHRRFIQKNNSYSIGTNFTQTGWDISRTLSVAVRRPVWALIRKITMLSDFSLAANRSVPVGSISKLRGLWPFVGTYSISVRVPLL
jgi:uncharacterized protein DUF421